MPQLIERARIYRKSLGGGMRQAGILAAPGLIALEQMTQRLAEDHANARYLAEQIAALPNVEIDLETVQTNIVIFSLRHQADANALVTRLKSRGVLASQVLGPHTLRLVTHHDVDRAACESAAAILAEEIAKPDR